MEGGREEGRERKGGREGIWPMRNLVWSAFYTCWKRDEGMAITGVTTRDLMHVLTLA
jgi:hypothetical protein